MWEKKGGVVRPQGACEKGGGPGSVVGGRGREGVEGLGELHAKEPTSGYTEECRKNHNLRGENAEGCRTKSKGKAGKKK